MSSNQDSQNIHSNEQSLQNLDKYFNKKLVNDDTTNILKTKNRPESPHKTNETSEINYEGSAVQSDKTNFID